MINNKRYTVKAVYVANWTTDDTMIYLKRLYVRIPDCAKAVLSCKLLGPIFFFSNINISTFKILIKREQREKDLWNTFDCKLAKQLFHISYSLPKLFDRPAKEKFKKRSTLTDGHFRHQEAKGQVPANQDRFPNPHQNNTTDEIENWTLRKVITFKKKKKKFRHIHCFQDLHCLVLLWRLGCLRLPLKDRTHCSVVSSSRLNLVHSSLFISKRYFSQRFGAICVTFRSNLLSAKNSVICS